MPISGTPDPRIQQVVSLLPADGSAIPYAQWRQAVIAQDHTLLPLLQSARQSKQVIFEVADWNDPVGSHVVRRAASIAAPTAASAAVPPAPQTPQG